MTRELIQIRLAVNNMKIKVLKVTTITVLDKRGAYSLMLGKKKGQPID